MKTDDVELINKSRAARFMNNHQRVFLNDDFNGNVFKISLCAKFNSKIKYGFYQNEDTDINPNDRKLIAMNSIIYDSDGQYIESGWSGPKKYEPFESGSVVEWIIDFINNVIAIKINEENYKLIFKKIYKNMRFYVEGDKDVEVNILGLWRNDRSLKNHIDCNEDWGYDCIFI